MRRKIKLFSTIAALIILSGCSRDFLEKDPLVQSSADTYYSNEEEANAAIIGIYSILQNEGTQLAPFMLIGDGASDNADIGNSNSEAYSWLGSPVKEFQRFEVTSTNWVSNQLWNQGFRGITWATHAIDRISVNEEIPEDKRNQFVGEAHFLRALYYFMLTRQYGALPIIDHTLSFEEYYNPRATIEETWAFIESDLQTAAELLPGKGEYAPEDLGRATKGAANARLGKAYIYQDDFNLAYEVLKTIVSSGNYGLQQNYSSIFTVQNENGIESIFEIQHMISSTGWADSNEGSILSFYEHDADPNDPIKWHNGWSMHNPTQDLVNGYEPGDPRLEATVIFPGEFWDGYIHKNIASTTGYQSKKWYIPYSERSEDDQSDNPKNIIFIRYADVLLYLSEAANEIGNTEESLIYLEEVRLRARLNSTVQDILPKITVTDKDELRQKIWEERRIELAMEGQRFWELVRQGRAGSVMRAYSENYNSIKGQSFTDGVNEIFPIPRNEIDISNGSLVQNPGYN